MVTKPTIGQLGWGDALNASLDELEAGKVAKEPARLRAKDYASLAALFAARDAIAGPAVIDLEASASYSAANLRIDKADTILNGNGATITLPAGANQDALRVGVDAIRLRVRALNLAGAYATQTGTSRGIVFEAYSGGAFRFADRSAVEDCNIDGFLTDGVVIEEKRLHVVVERTFIRDYGRYGIDIRASDCRFINGAAGGIRGQYGVRVDASATWVADNGIYSNSVAGVLLTEKATGCKIVNNDLDNNMGGGLRAVGAAGTALRTTIAGNHFRANSTQGDGLHSDIYLEQVSQILLADNQAYLQDGSTARTKHVVEAGAGVDSVQDFGNTFSSTYPTVGRWNTAAVTARKTRVYALDFLADGSSDVTFRRQGAGVEVTNDFTSLGTNIGARLSVSGKSDGTGFLSFGAEQSPDPAAPGANGARVFTRDNGAGKTQLCVRFATGAVQVLATEP